MSYLGDWLPTAIGVVTMVVMTQQGALAKTAREVSQVAQAITVKVPFVKRDLQGYEFLGNGSGILLQKAGDVYTVLTAAHVVRGQVGERVKLSTIMTPDGQQHQVVVGSMRLYRGDVDLAVVEFRSRNNYKLAELGNSNILESGMDLYVAGFPLPTGVITESLFVFREGKVSANSKRAFKDGYALLYSNDTLPGMSGGPVLDETGRVVGMHGKGDREYDSGAKTRFNAGIPIARFVDVARELGIEAGPAVVRTMQSPTLTIDDYFISAYQKDENQDYQGALADYSQVIALKPDHATAYYNRGVLKHLKLNDSQGALADYNQAISLQKRSANAFKLDDAKAYYNRGILKHRKLNDFQGALADFSTAITLKPDYSVAYYNRGNLKYQELNDFQGALVDFSTSIDLKPNEADGAYYSRGNLKYQELNDFQGAVADFNKAIQINPQFAYAYRTRGLVKVIELNDRPGGIADLRKAARLAGDQDNAQLLQSILKTISQLGANE